jgi:hypothetical protein
MLCGLLLMLQESDVRPMLSISNASRTLYAAFTRPKARGSGRLCAARKSSFKIEKLRTIDAFHRSRSVTDSESELAGMGEDQASITQALL